MDRNFLSIKEPDELPFKKGEVLEVLSKDERTQWWKARNKHGQTGFIPMNYISNVSIVDYIVGKWKQIE